MVYLFLVPNDGKMTTDERVRLLAGEYFKLSGIPIIAPCDLKIVRSERGKPYFEGLETICFSVSHSGEIFACAFSDEALGIDVQEYKKRPDEAERCCKIAQRFFHPDEVDALDADTVSAFYNIWTAKEAYVKLTGRGIDGDFSEFCIFDLDEYLFQTEVSDYAISVCTSDISEVEIIDRR